MSEQFSNNPIETREVSRDGGGISGNQVFMELEEIYGPSGSNLGNDTNDMNDGNTPQADGGNGGGEGDNGYLRPSEQEGMDPLEPGQPHDSNENAPMDQNQEEHHELPGPPSELDGDCDVEIEDDIEMEVGEGDVELARGTGSQDNGMPKRFLSIPPINEIA